MRNLILLLAILMIFTSCGGDSNDFDSEISGTWKGELLQGVIFCSDGTAVGAGAGSILREVRLEIVGSDEIGSVVKISDGNCLLEGVRDIEGFVANPVSGCEEGLSHITFKISKQNNAYVTYYPALRLVAEESDEIYCDIIPSGELRR